MSTKPVAVYYGSVQAFEPSFRDGPFSPWNAAYASFRPSSEPVEGPYGAVLEIFEGEWFSVDAVYSSEGPTNFLHYPDAYRRSRSAGEYGGNAHISICSAAEDRVITALDAQGNEVPVFSQTRHLACRLADRLVFPNR